jgi:hypothetical protein
LDVAIPPALLEPFLLVSVLIPSVFLPSDFMVFGYLLSLIAYLSLLTDFSELLALVDVPVLAFCYREGIN